MVLGDGEDDVAVGVVFDLREGTLVTGQQNRPHGDGVDGRGGVSGRSVIGGRVSDKFDDSAVAVWVPIAKWDGFGANRPSRTNRRRADDSPQLIMAHRT